MRKPHLLKGNKDLEQPEDFIFFDTETLETKLSDEEVEHIFRLGVALYWRRRIDGSPDVLQWLNFTDISQFWDFVESKSFSGRRLVLLAHNISYDMRILKGFETMRERGYILVKLISDSFVNIWKFRKQGKTLLFLDSMNFFNFSLKELGKDLGLAKMPMPEFKESHQLWFTYCKRDVEILYKGIKTWLEFIKLNNLGSFALTLAGQSFNSFRHRFNSFPIFIHSNQQAIDLERESYHGGRTECFFVGTLPLENYHYLDVISMYPSVMISNTYPTRLRSFTNSLSVSNLKRLLASNCLISKVFLETSEPAFPYKIFDKLCFPVGKFWTVLSTRELLYALSKDYIKEVRETAVYQAQPIFVDYVNFFHQCRQTYRAQGNFSFSIISKLLLNSLYGKWGQRNEIFKVIAKDTDYPDGIYEVWNVEEQKKDIYRSMNGVLEKSVGKKEAFHSFPAIASHITADARLVLWNYIKLAGQNNVFYCDTDSLFVNSVGAANLKAEFSASVLGKLKLKGTAQNLEIRGLKDYTFGDSVRMKGIRPDAEKLADNKFRQWQWEGMRGSLRNARINRVILKKITKILYRDYFKGLVEPSGKVVPYQVQQLCL